jgi:hypothetical protein
LELERWEIGEILIFNDFHSIKIQSPESELEPEPEPEKIINFYTSEQVKLVGIEEMEYSMNPIKYKSTTNFLNLKDALDEKFEKYYLKLNKLIKNNKILVYKMALNKISDLTEQQEIPIYYVYSIHTDSEKLHQKIQEVFDEYILKLKIICAKIVDKSEISNIQKCDINNEVDKKINKLYSDLQTNTSECFAQLNYGYCITVHKSQGSTFKNVFIDVNDIFDKSKIDETTKCLYTSITRSSKSLNMYI